MSHTSLFLALVLSSCFSRTTTGFALVAPGPSRGTVMATRRHMSVADKAQTEEPPAVVVVDVPATSAEAAAPTTTTTTTTNGAAAPGEVSTEATPTPVSPRPAVAMQEEKTEMTLRFKRYTDLEQSVLFPSLPRPELLDGSHAGDYGFDPLGLATSPETLFAYMECEIRHARLAMLCAAGWPLSELRPMFDGALLADGGRAPSVLNGHLFDSVSLLVVVAFFAAVAKQEVYALTTPKKDTLYGHIHSLDLAPIADEWPWGVAGDQNFDPLGLYGLVGKDAVGRKVLRDLELSHGRVAMLAVLSYVLLEVTTGRPVVDLTPFLFNNY